MEFIYRLKRFTKQKEFIFWTLVFPIVLGTLFKVAFGNLNNINVLSEVKVSIIQNEYAEKDPILMEVLESITLKENSPEKMFIIDKIEVKTEAEYLALLDGEIDAIIETKEQGYNLLIRSNDMSQEIIKNILDQVIQTTDYIKTVGEKDPTKIPQALELMNEQIDSIKYHFLGKNEVDNTIIYFYTLIAMTAIYACFWGNKEIEDLSIESSIGKRVYVSSNNRIKTLSINLGCSYLINLVGNFLVLLFLKFVLRVNLALGSTFLLCAVGGFTGLMLGAFISLHVKGSANTKQGITTSIVMFMSFCSGMMSNEIKYLLDTHAPFINYINPVNLITESLYQLFYYGFNEKVYLCIFGILAIGILLLTFSLIKVRRIKL